MLRRISIIFVLIFLATLFEYIAFNVFFRWLKPNFGIIFVVFFNLYWGSPYGLAAAIISGIIRDSWGPHNFGLNIFSLVACNFMITMTRKYFYHIGSEASRLPMVWVLCVLNILLQYILYLIFYPFGFGRVFFHVMLPEILMTGLAAAYTLKWIKKCVVKFSVPGGNDG